MGSTKNQYIAAIAANLGTVIYGTVVGWASPSLPVLQSKTDSPLEVPLTVEEGSLVGGLLCLGAIFGIFIFMYLVDEVGRKTSACIMAVPYLLNWVFIILAKNSTHIFVARVFAGIGAGGSFSVTPLYVAEISEDRVRGRLGSLLVLAMNTGIIFVYVTGTFLSYNTLPYVMMIVPILYFIAVLYVPETPQYLARKGKVNRAVDSLKWLRGEPKNLDTEIDELDKDIVELNLLADTKISTEPETTNKNKVTMSDLMDGVVLKGSFISFMLMFFQAFSGHFGVLSYAALIFKEAGSSLSPNVSAIIIGVILFVGTYIATMYVERFGRKMLLTISSVGTCVCVTILGTYSYLKEHKYEVQSFGWLPLVALSLFEFMFAIGLGPVSFVVVAEVFSTKIRPVALSLSQVCSWIFTFVIATFFNPIVQALGLYGCFWIFATCMFLSTLFCRFYLFETKGRSLNDILEHMERKNKIDSK